MATEQAMLSELKITGSKITKTRTLLVKIFQRDRLPLTELEIRDRLFKAGAKVNKTTVYRELAHLKKNNLIKEIEFGDGKKRYELASGKHHHHLVCTACNKIDEIYTDNDMNLIEKQIIRQKRFKIQNHSLEFFGVCESCVKNN